MHSVSVRREFLRSSLLGAAALSMRPASAASSFDARRRQTTWGMNTNVDTWRGFAKSPAEAIAGIGPLLLGSGCTLVREGLMGDMGGNDLDAMNWSRWFDPWVDWLAAHGMQLALQLHLNNVRNPGYTYDGEWERRVVHKAQTVARYINASPQRRRVLAWFMLINEPDLNPGMAGGFMTPQRLVRYHELAWREIKSVNPRFLIEGLTFGDAAGIGAAFPLRAFNLNTVDRPAAGERPTPGKSVPGMVVQDVLSLGITRWCDLVGFHSYLEITDENPHGPRALVQHMRAAHEQFGHPIRPVVNTETGCHDSQLNRIGTARGRGRKPVDVSADARDAAIAHWQHLNRVQQARWGVSRAIYYSLGASSADWMNLVDYRAAGQRAAFTKRPTFATAIDAIAPRPLPALNGGFEAPEDKFSNWVVHYHPHDFRSDDLVYGEWKETEFRHDGDRTGIRAPGSRGKGYLRLAAGLPKRVRRVVDGLPDGKTFRVAAWVRQESTGAATLAVYGFDQNNPGCSATASMADAGRWVQLAVSFTTQRSLIGVECSAVISLEVDGKSTVYWDDVTVTAT